MDNGDSDNNRYAALLREFGNTIGLVATDQFVASEELIVDDVSLGFSRRVSVEGPEVWCFTFLGHVAASNPSESYRLLLEANDYWSGTGGATVSVQALTGKVRLCMKLTLATTNAPLLAMAVERFVSASKLLRTILEPETAGETPTHDGVFTHV